jgi:hypothetical protein
MPNDALEWILLLVGCAMGVFYGFDGWRGSLKDLELKDSPRVKNFIWVATVAFGTFIADFKIVDPDVKKPRLLLFYLTGFMVVSLLVILGWAAAIFLKFSYTKLFDAINYPIPPFTPVWDYLRYGYGYHNQRYEDALKKSRDNELERRKQELERANSVFEEYRQQAEQQIDELKKEITIQQSRRHIDAFLPAYFKQIPLAIAAVDHFRMRPDRATRTFVAKQILQSIAAVVFEYYGEVPGLRVNCNYMIAYHKSSPPKDLSSRLRYSWGDHSRYDYFLSLEDYAFDFGREDFVLPVEGKGTPGYLDRVLPGAPLAFVRNMPVIVDDTKTLEYAKDTDPGVVEESKKYFEGKREDFKSFACLNILGGGKQLGIVHIESNTEFIFGKSKNKTEEILSLLQPFCLLLGNVIGTAYSDA